MPAKAEAIAGAVVIAKADMDHSQKADLHGQATVPIVAVAIHLSNVKPLAKNAITVIKKAIFHSTVDPSNVDVHLPNPDTAMAPGSPIMISMTQTSPNLMMLLHASLSKTQLPLNSNVLPNGDILTLCLMRFQLYPHFSVY